ncbi:hypothetical protein BREVNS_1574 [Brevinematales bacterium NS]|jgi:uncharacterized membrane protein (UPF0127 family)|nr:DUF192 domain-containing protein [Brevinematales bacterium]QJR22324.1 hypothetical protein BREVNS_1574 [Brevinematales bacterium NS]
MFTNLLVVSLLTQQLVFALALTEEEQRTGMMYRTNWGNWAGMIFVFPKPQQVAFWMKNTPLPMPIVYVDEDLSVLEIHEGAPFSTYTMVSRSAQVRYVLELNPATTNIIWRHYGIFRKQLKKELVRRKL